MELTIYHHLAISLGLGLLVGLQREWVSKKVAGIRTFPIITLLGTLSAALAEQWGGATLAAAFLGVAAMLVLGNIPILREKDRDFGITTEVAVLLMFAVGAAVRSGHVAPAIVTSGLTALLLHWKIPLHELVKRIGDDDIRAISRLVLIALVILPVLPDETYGPYNVLNPFQIWTMVVLIVGISLAAYMVYRVVGARAGTLLTGFFGGLISSTATTVGYARNARRGALGPNMAAVVIMLASTIVFGRVLIEIAVVAPALLVPMAPPLIATMGVIGLMSLWAYIGARRELADPPKEMEPPSDMKAAIIFGLLYAVVLFGVAFAKDQFGDAGMYVVAALSGLTDMDAITLSTANLITDDKLDVNTGWRLILVGALSNMVFKGTVVSVLGTFALFRRVALRFLITIAIGAAIILLWP